MKQLLLIPLAVVTVALLGGPGLHTFIPSVGIAIAQGQDEEEVLQMKKHGMKRNQGQVSNPGIEKKSMKKEGVVVEEKQKSKTREGLVVEEKQKKSKQKSKQKLKKKAPK